MTIYLGRMLPYGSSDYEGRDGQPLNAPISILLRVGFTGTRHVTMPPVGSYPTFPSLPKLIRRFISVALSLKSPSPDVIRHPCPVELGLSSRSKTPSRSHLAYSIIKHNYLLIFISIPQYPDAVRNSDISRGSDNSGLEYRGSAAIAPRTA